MSGGPDVGGCSWLFLLKADGGLILPGRGMGLLRSPSQASQLPHRPHRPHALCTTGGMGYQEADDSPSRSRKGNHYVQPPLE